MEKAFASACADAARRPEAWAEVRERFRHVDLLAVDGLESLARVPPALEELAHTLDALEARARPWPSRRGRPRGAWRDGRRGS